MRKEDAGNGKREPLPVAMIFIDSFVGDKIHGFLGASVDAIMADTYEGTRFDFYNLRDGRQISLEEMEDFGFEYYESARKTVKSCWSVYLGSIENRSR